jgi:hypothetical protein
VNQLICFRVAFASPFFTSLWNEDKGIVIELLGVDFGTCTVNENVLGFMFTLVRAL